MEAFVKMYYTKPMNLVIYFLLFFVEFLFLATICVYYVSVIHSNIKGAPFVPTTNKRLREIFAHANLKKGGYFFELGCGDGRAVHLAARDYGMIAYGCDVNPFLIRYARFVARLRKIKNTTFERKNILDVDVKKADAVYMFLLPELMQKVRPHLERQLKKGTLVIAHGFEMKGWESKLKKTLPAKHFRTFYYQVS